MTRVELPIPQAAALPLLGAVLAVLFLARPAEMRRDPLLEIQGVLKISPSYTVAYTDCADRGDDTVRTDLVGLARGFAGRSSLDFVAHDDADAVAFARAARPDCRVVLIDRYRRFDWRRSRAGRRQSVDLSRYPVEAAGAT